MLFKVLALTALVLLAGCAPKPTANPQSMDLGPQPDVEAIMFEWFQRRLADPESVKDFAYTLPWKCLAKPDQEYEYGWCGRVKYNAKNRLGIYAGLNEFEVMFQDGRLRRIKQHFF